MNINEAREIYGEQVIRQLYDLCPGCGEDNMPTTYEWLMGTALKICPKCGLDRTPSPCGEY